MIKFKDSYIYSPDEAIIKQAILRLMREGYSHAEIMYLAERVVFAELFCTRNLDNRSVAKMLGLSEASTKDTRDSMNFTPVVEQRKKTRLEIAKAAEKARNVDDLQKRVLRRLEKEKEGEV